MSASNPTPPEAFERLCSELLDGSIDEAGREQLVELVRNDAGLLEELRNHLLVSGTLARMNPEFSDERFSHSISTHLERVGDETAESFPSLVSGRIRRHRFRRRLAVGAAAAAVVLASAPLYLMQRNQPSPPEAAVAVALHLGRAHQPKPESEMIEPGRRIDLDEGVMRLNFANGAVVAIEAPAAFTVPSGEEIILSNGNLNAWCPESAHGFRVKTGTATLTDLGTSFGVSASADGSADFIVLDGEVEVESRGDKRNLLKGSALHASRTSELEDRDFETSAFTRTWPVASGIESTTGEVIPAPPNTPEALAAHEDDEHVLVIPERRTFKLPPKLPADIREPGTYGGDPPTTNLHGPNGLVTKGDKTARSFLLRYNPVGTLEFMEFRHFEGSVTFDRPILAIITSTGKLRMTDQIATSTPLPEPEINPGMRGVEGGPKTDPDRITLSEDRRTISVLFNAGESVDEIRVITEAD